MSIHLKRNIFFVYKPGSHYLLPKNCYRRFVCISGEEIQVSFNFDWAFFHYTEFILVQLFRKLLAYRITLDSVPGTNQYWAMSIKFLAQGNNGLSLAGFEPMRLGIIRLLVRRVNHSTTPPPLYFGLVSLDGYTFYQNIWYSISTRCVFKKDQYRSLFFKKVKVVENASFLLIFM